MTAARKMVQVPLSLLGLYDSDARLYGQPLQPKTRGECVGERAERRAGEKTCQHFRCRYNLLGELTRRKEENAVEAMRARFDGEWLDSCALDYADAVQARAKGDLSEWSKVDDSDFAVAKMLGVTDRHEWARICDESNSRAKAAIERGEK